MEEETYTRWLYPGIFAAGTFLWLVYIFHYSDLSKIQEFWREILMVLVTGIPVIGFIAGFLVYIFVGGYSGWGTSKARALCKESFKGNLKIH